MSSLPQHRARPGQGSGRWSSVRRFLGIALFVGAFGVSCIWIRRGFDMTDEGYNLSRQWLILSHPSAIEPGMTWLSDVLGGIWLRLIGSLGLLGARIGWALVVSLTAWVSFAALRGLFDPLVSALAVLGAVVACNYLGVLIPDYNTIPALLLLGATALLLIPYATVRRPRKISGENLRYLLSGVLLGLSVLCRFPMILGLGVPLVLGFLSSCDETKVEHCATLRAALLPLAGAGTALAVGAIALASTGSLSSYVLSIREALFGPGLTSSHLPVNLMTLYIAEVRKALGWGLKLGSIAFGMCLASYVASTMTRRWFVVLATILPVSGLLAYLLANLPKGSYDYRAVFPGFFLVVALLEVAILIPRVSERSRPMATIRVLIAGLLLAVLAMLGSNNGAYSMKFGLYLLIPGVALAAPSAMDRLVLILRGILRRTRLRARLSDRPAVYAAFLPVALVLAFSINSWMIREANPYRDLPDRSLLQYPIDAPRLDGIMTSKQRAESATALFDQLEQLVDPGESMLAVNSIPMVHYVTGTIPALGNPWPTIFSRDRLRQELGGLSPQQAPVVVLAKTNTRRREWGTGPVLPPTEEQQSKIRDVEAWLEDSSYRLQWENPDFSVFLWEGSTSQQDRSGRIARR